MIITRKQTNEVCETSPLTRRGIFLCCLQFQVINNLLTRANPRWGTPQPNLLLQLTVCPSQRWKLCRFITKEPLKVGKEGRRLSVYKGLILNVLVICRGWGVWTEPGEILLESIHNIPL